VEVDFKSEQSSHSMQGAALGLLLLGLTHGQLLVADRDLDARLDKVLQQGGGENGWQLLGRSISRLEGATLPSGLIRADQLACQLALVSAVKWGPPFRCALASWLLGDWQSPLLQDEAAAVGDFRRYIQMICHDKISQAAIEVLEWVDPREHGLCQAAAGASLVAILAATDQSRLVPPSVIRAAFRVFEFGLDHSQGLSSQAMVTLPNLVGMTLGDAKLFGMATSALQASERGFRGMLRDEGIPWEQDQSLGEVLARLFAVCWKLFPRQSLRRLQPDSFLQMVKNAEQTEALFLPSETSAECAGYVDATPRDAPGTLPTKYIWCEWKLLRKSVTPEMFQALKRLGFPSTCANIGFMAWHAGATKLTMQFNAAAAFLDLAGWSPLVRLAALIQSGLLSDGAIGDHELFDPLEIYMAIFELSTPTGHGFSEWRDFGNACLDSIEWASLGGKGVARSLQCARVERPALSPEWKEAFGSVLVNTGLLLGVKGGGSASYPFFSAWAALTSPAECSCQASARGGGALARLGPEWDHLKLFEATLQMLRWGRTAGDWEDIQWMTRLVRDLLQSLQGSGPIPPFSLTFMSLPPNLRLTAARVEAASVEHWEFPAMTPEDSQALRQPSSAPYTLDPLLTTPNALWNGDALNPTPPWLVLPAPADGLVTVEGRWPMVTSPVVAGSGVRVLHVLYSSHDLNSHPTGVMVEGLARYHSGNRARRRFAACPDCGVASTRLVHASAAHYGNFDGTRVMAVFLRTFFPFAPLRGLSGSDMLAAARSVGPHIAIDLQGPTNGGKESMFSSRIAPIQAIFLILPTTSARRGHDYAIVDRVVVPPERASQTMTERLVYLPVSYQSNYWPPMTTRDLDARLRVAAGLLSSLPPTWAALHAEPILLQRAQRTIAHCSELSAADLERVRESFLPRPFDSLRDKSRLALHWLASEVLDENKADAAFRSRGVPSFRFASFNKQEKWTPETLRSWCNILRSVPGSVLLVPGKVDGNDTIWSRRTIDEATLRSRNSSNIVSLQRVQAFLASCGVAPSRLIALPLATKRSHMLRMRHIDLMIDNINAYGAHSTASDALRAGLPVLTGSFGQTFERRVGLSILRALDLSHILAPESVRSYESTAVSLGRDVALLRALKKKVARHVLASARVEQGEAPAAYCQAFFNPPVFTEAMERAYRAMFDVFSVRAERALREPSVVEDWARASGLRWLDCVGGSNWNSQHCRGRSPLTMNVVVDPSTRCFPSPSFPERDPAHEEQHYDWW
jgi:hypothetical protein